MPSRTRIRCALALLVVLVLVPAGLARANDAYDRVAAAYGQAAGQLDPCTFSTVELESALRGIPREIASYVPAVRQAIESAISAREQGQCRGRRPTGLTTSSATPPPVTTTPPATTTPGVATTPGAVTPGAGTTTPDTEGPQAGVPSEPPVQTAPAAPTPPPVQTTQTTTTPGTVVASDGNGKHELLIALIALGAIVLAALLAWAVARWRGWDAGWARRWRHAWGEAAFRTSSTWSEFTDWLRLGR